MFRRKQINPHNLRFSSIEIYSIAIELQLSRLESIKMVSMTMFRAYAWTFNREFNHVIAVYSENKLQHYASAYRNPKSSSKKLGLFKFCTFLRKFSANTLQPVQKSLFN